MMTIRGVREAVAGLIHKLPEAPLSPDAIAAEFFGGHPALEASIAESLAKGLADPETWPAGLEPATVPHVKLRLMFAAECLRQMEAASPQEMIPGAAIPVLLRHAVIDQWPQQGKAWALATFGPKRRGR